MSVKLKEFLPSIVSVIVMIVGILIFSSVSLYQSSNVNNLQNEIVELKNNIDKLSIENNTTITRVKSQATGIDSSRVEKDNEAVSTLMKKVFTWNSYKEYMAIREDLMKKYNLATDSDFMTTFMPEIYNEKIEDKDYNRIDVNGYNISFNNITTYVVKVDDKNKIYEYFAVVDVTSKSSNDGTADYKLALQYKMNDSQQIMDLVGYTLN
jgi:hypothetical protein